MFLRSFFLQVVLNYERMQGLGFGIIILPIARSLELRGKELSDFLRRSFSFFNSHPYYANYAAGAVSRLEMDKASEREIKSLKEQLLGPLGLLGDQVFWYRLKPLFGLCAVIAVLLICWPVRAGFRNEYIPAVVSILILYNILHLWVRRQGLIKGYASGSGVIEVLKNSFLIRRRRLLGLICAFTAGYYLINVSHISDHSIGFWSAFVSASICLYFRVRLWAAVLFSLTIALVFTFIAEIRIF